MPGAVVAAARQRPARPFLLVTPAHDEASQAEALVAAVRRSTLLPSRWIVVDDGSNDGTAEAFRKAAGGWPVLQVHRLDEHGEYMGFRYSEVVQAGLAQLDFPGQAARESLVGILDADIRFGPDYWESLHARLTMDPRLGVVSGALCSPNGRGHFRVEPGQFEDMPRGGLRLMRAQCLSEIGGWSRSRAPDALVNVQARLAGWRTELCPSILAVSTRPTGSRDNYEDAARSYGQRFYDLGRPTWFITYKAATAAARRRWPRARGLLEGYFGEWLEGPPRSGNPAVRKYYRFEPFRRLFERAGAKLEGKRPQGARVPVRTFEAAELGDWAAEL